MGQFSELYNWGLLNCTILARGARFHKFQRVAICVETFVINTIAEFNLVLEQIIRAQWTKDLIKLNFCCLKQKESQRMDNPIKVSLPYTEVSKTESDLCTSISTNKKGKIALFSFSHVNTNPGCNSFNNSMKTSDTHYQSVIDVSVITQGIFNTCKHILLIKINKNDSISVFPWQKWFHL